MAVKQPISNHPANSDIAFEALAAFNKAASDPLRLEVLRALRNNSFGVLELCHILDVKQSALSHHLKILAQAELVNTRREGNSIFYQRECRHNDDTLQLLQCALFQQVDQLVLSKSTLARIKHIQKERTARSKEFFRDQAECFEQQQERIATHSVYSKAVIELLNNSNLQQFNSAIEVGPGNGEFLSQLAEHFKKVIALDNEKEMLRRAKQYATEQSLENIQFIHGDTDHAVQKNIKADCIVLNMVLHHTPSPAELFDDFFKILNDGGILLVTEICRHQQDWVKQACGDLWLGFESEELLQWANNAGLVSQQSTYQALRNGFQIQLHCFQKNNFQQQGFQENSLERKRSPKFS